MVGQVYALVHVHGALDGIYWPVPATTQSVFPIPISQTNYKTKSGYFMDEKM